MASGTISLGSQGYLVGQIVWSSTANGTTANNSTVTASLQIKRSNSYTTTGTWGGSLQVGSSSSSISYYGGVSSSWVTVKSITTTVAHNSNGTGTCYIYGKVTGPSGTSMSGYALSSSKTVTLDTIPRAATLSSAPNFDDEDNPVITYSNPAGNSVTSLKACISSDGSSDDLATYRDISKTGTSYTFSLTDAERTKLRTLCANAKSATVRFYVRTTIGSTNYHSYIAKTLTIVNATPMLSPTVVDSNTTTTALTGDSSKFVKGYSNAAFVVNATALKNSTIKSRKVTCGSKSSTAASGTLNAVESATFTFTTTDSRGYTATKTLTKTLINYVDLTCVLKPGNPTADGDMAMSISGAYFNGSFGTTANTLTVQYRRSLDGGTTWEDWSTVTPTLSGNSYSATVTFTGLDYQQAYTFQARAMDELHTSGVNTDVRTVRSTPVFDWGEGDFRFNVPVHVGGEIYVDVNGDNTGVIRGIAPDGETYLAALQPCNQNGNMVMGYGSYDAARNGALPEGVIGNTNLYAGNSIYMYVAGNSSGTTPGCVFEARNSHGNMIINHAGYANSDSKTYLRGNELYLESKSGNIYINSNLLADQIVAQGTSGVWYYIKFANGLAICSCNYGGTVSSYAGPYASLLYGYYGEIAYPFSFVSRPNAAYTLQIGTGFSIPAGTTHAFGDENTKTTLRWYGLGTVSGTQSVYLNAVVIGRWK